jgi:hypothetical protein
MADAGSCDEANTTVGVLKWRLRGTQSLVTALGSFRTKAVLLQLVFKIKSPFIFFAIARLTYSPIPEPWLLVVNCGSNIFSRNSSGIPEPESVISYLQVITKT